MAHLRFRHDLFTTFSALQCDDDISVRIISIRSLIPLTQSDHAPLIYLHSKHTHTHVYLENKSREKNRNVKISTMINFNLEFHEQNRKSMS